MTAADQNTVWFGGCTYWTEDPAKLVDGPDGPVCPQCGQPKTPVPADMFHQGNSYLGRQWPDYVAFVESLREVCHGHDLVIADVWFKREQ